jgi:hypothetical protein
MSILNRPSDGLLSVLLALRRALIAYGPQSEDRLLALCTPGTVVLDGKREMAKKTLTRWTQLGVFKHVDGRVELHPDVASVGADNIDRLREVLLRCVLSTPNNPALAGERRDGDGDDHEGSLASDFTRAAAWALAQDPYAFNASWRGVERLQAEQAAKPRLFANDTRWAGFVEWAVFLGLGWTAARVGLVLDPAFAVRSVLEEVFSGSLELNEQLFFTRLAETLPILDRGRYRLVTEVDVGRPWRSTGPNEVSPCLSAALLHLEASGHLRIETRSDAPSQKVLVGRGGRELRAVSHLLSAGRS